MAETKLSREETRLSQDKIAEQKANIELQKLTGGVLDRHAWELFASNLLTGISDWSGQLPDLVESACCRNCKRKVPKRIKKELDDLRTGLAQVLEDRMKEHAAQVGQQHE